MGFEKVYITKQGALLAAKTLQGKKIEFDHAEVGSGNLTGNAVDKTSLTTKVLECPIERVEITGDTQACVSFIFKNTDAKAAFNFREIGLFAIDPDTKAKVLYAYANAGTTAEYINNSITEKIEKHININVIVDNATNITITLDENEIYITEKEFQERLREALTVAGKTYGVRRKIKDNTNPAWERIGDSVGLIAKATHDGSPVQNDFDDLYPWSDIRTYNYNTETKKITAYIDEPGFQFDGSNGEVLTKIPEFWFKREVKGDYEYIYIADYAKAGFKHSKEFSVGRYTISVGEDTKAHSYSGTIPEVNKNIAAFRTLATGVGDEFCQLDTRYFILQMLYLVEYANYNSQSMLGNGYTSMEESTSDVSLLEENGVNRFVVRKEGGNNFEVGQLISIGTAHANNSIAANRTITKIADFDNGSVTGKEITFDGEPVDLVKTNVIWSPAQKHGGCDDLGMKSGCLSNTHHAVIYRGIENIFGNVYQFVDGLNIKDYIAYVCDDPTQYASDKFVAPYKAVGYTNLKTSNIYPSKLGYDENYPEIALPTEANGSTGTGICDAYWSSEGQRIARVGGSVDLGANAGLFFWHLNAASSHSYWNIGARLLKYQ